CWCSTRSRSRIRFPVVERGFNETSPTLASVTAAAAFMATSAVSPAAAAVSTTTAAAVSAAAAAAAAPGSALLRFVHADSASVEVPTVHTFDGCFAVGAVREGDEAESARAASIAIHDHSCVDNFTKLLESATEAIV